MRNNRGKDRFMSEKIRKRMTVLLAFFVVFATSSAMVRPGETLNRDPARSFMFFEGESESPEPELINAQELIEKEMATESVPPVAEDNAQPSVSSPDAGLQSDNAEDPVNSADAISTEKPVTSPATSTEPLYTQTQSPAASVSSPAASATPSIEPVYSQTPAVSISSPVAVGTPAAAKTPVATSTPTPEATGTPVATNTAEATKTPDAVNTPEASETPETEDKKEPTIIFNKWMPVKTPDKKFGLQVKLQENSKIPEDASVELISLDKEDEDYSEYYDKAIEAVAKQYNIDSEQLSVLDIFDLSIYDADGNTVQPSDSSKVEVNMNQYADAENIHVVHFVGSTVKKEAEEAAVEEAAPSRKLMMKSAPALRAESTITESDISTDNIEILKTKPVGDGTVTFETESFSVYAIVSGYEDATFEFYYTEDSEQPFETQVVPLNGELEDVGTPAVSAEENETFVGWFIKNNDEWGEQVFFNIPITYIVEGTTYKVYPKYETVLRVLFYDESGNVHEVKNIPESGMVTIDDVDLPANGVEGFAGWSVNSSDVKIDDVILCDENGQIEIDVKNKQLNYKTAGNTEQQTKDLENGVTLKLYPVFSTAHWIEFHSQAIGSASYTAPIYLLDEETPAGSNKKPDDPIRPGYEFGGWYKDQECSDSMLFGQWDDSGYNWNNETGTLTKDLDLYAKWIETYSYYSIYFWWQNADDDEYVVHDIEYVGYDAETKTVNNTVATKSTTTVATPSGDISAIYTSEQLENKYVDDHFKLSSDQDHSTDGKQNVIVEKEVTGDGRTIVNVYYDRFEYTLRFYYARSYETEIGGSMSYTSVATQRYSNRRYILSWKSEYNYNANEVYYGYSYGSYFTLTYNSNYERFNNGNFGYTGDVYIGSVTGGSSTTFIQVNNNNGSFSNASANSTLNDVFNNRGASNNDYIGGIAGGKAWRSLTADSAVDLLDTKITDNPAVYALGSEERNTETWIFNNQNSNNTSYQQGQPMTYYFVDMKVRYGQSIGSIWPTGEGYFKNQTGSNYNYDGFRGTNFTAVSWGTRRGTGFYNALHGGDGNSNPNNDNYNINGLYGTVDTNLFTSKDAAKDGGIAYFLCYWGHSTIYYYTFNCYYSLTDAEQKQYNSGNTNGVVTWNGKQYKLSYTQEGVRSTLGADTANPLAFDGVTFVNTGVKGNAYNANPYYADQSGGTVNNPREVRFYYDRNVHKINYIFDITDSDTLYEDDTLTEEVDTSGFETTYTEKDVKYGEPLDGLIPTEFTVNETKKVLSSGKTYTFRGWYDNGAFEGEPVTLEGTMPDHDLNLYAKWEEDYYTIKLDPNGGELLGNYSTFTWLRYGELISEPTGMTRNYVDISNISGVDTESDTKYSYVLRDYAWYEDQDVDPWDDYGTDEYNKAVNQAKMDLQYKSTAGRGAGYFEDSSGTYIKSTGAYTLIGWFEVDAEGNESEVEYDFNNLVTRDITLRAKWQLAGTITAIQYYDTNAAGEIVDNNPVYVDETGYTDEAHAVTYDALTSYPEGCDYFVGWQLLDKDGNAVDGEIYTPGELFAINNDYVIPEIHHEHSETTISYIVKFKAVYGKQGTTSIIYDANGGELSDTYIADTGETLDNDAKTLTLTNVSLNTMYQTHSNVFIRDGYSFIGWSLTSDATEPDFQPEEDISVAIYAAGEEKLTLYAVWVPVYGVTIIKEVDGLESDVDALYDFNYSYAEITGSFKLTGNSEGVIVDSQEYKNSIVIENIPSGTAFVLDETENVNYTATAKYKNTDSEESEYNLGDKEGIIINDNIEIVVTNTRNTQPVAFRKVDYKDSSTKLAGAEFTMVNADQSEEYILRSTNGDFNAAKVVDGVKTTVTVLPVGVYTITETKAPDGYNIATGTITVTITSDSVKWQQPDNNGGAPQTAVKNDNGDYVVIITNTSGVELPMTGGSGTLPYTFSGLVLILFAVMYGFRMRRGERRNE